MANLIDFNSAQLQTLLNIVVARIVEEDEHKMEWLSKFSPGYGQYNADYFYHTTIRPLRPTDYEHLCLWRTQILDAIGKVGMGEIIQSN